MKSKIKFVSYDGEFPNLCAGKLVVKYGKRTLTFYGYETNREKDIYPQFWCSGGSVSFDNDWNANVTGGIWELVYDKRYYPKEILDLLPEIIDVMNENVRHGCCGGCV